MPRKFKSKEKEIKSIHFKWGSKTSLKKALEQQRSLTRAAEVRKTDLLMQLANNVVRHTQQTDEELDKLFDDYIYQNQLYTYMLTAYYDKYN